MKTKKRFFLKAAGISLAKAAGISLALVMMFAMAFAACDTGTSSGGSGTGTGTGDGTGTGTGTGSVPPKSNTFTDASGTVELTITEILSVSTSAGTQTVDSRTAFSVAAPTSGERFYYAIRVKGYSAPVSSGTVTVGESAWSFSSYEGKSFTINVSVSGERLIFASTTIPTDNGTTTITIPTLNAPDTGSNPIYPTPASPSEAQKAATALAAALGSDKATVSGTTVTLTANVAIPAGETLSIPDGVTLAVANNTTLDLSELEDTGAVTLTGTIVVASGGTLKVPAPSEDAATKGKVTQIEYDDGGSITLNSGASAYFDEQQYIGPVNGGDPFYTWDSGDDDATVELKGDEIVLNGNLTLAKPEYLLHKATIESGTLTVAAGLTLVTDAELVVKNGATLDLGTDGSITKNGGTITNEGTIKTADTDGSTLEALLTTSTGVAAGTVEVSAEVTLSNDASVPEHVTLKVSEKLTVDGATLTVADNATLTVADNATLTVADNATLINEGTIAFDAGSSLEVTGSIDNDASATIQTADGTVLGTLLENVTDGTIEVTGDSVELDDEETYELGEEVTLKIADEKVLTIGEGTTLTVEGDITVEGTLIHAASSTAELNGTITVEVTGIYKDLNPGGGTVWGGDSAEGTITWTAGAKGYVGGEAATNLRIGASTDPEATTLVQLATGTLKNTKTGYELDGTATVRGNFGLTAGEFKITSGTLTVDIKWQGAGRPSPFTVDGVYLLGQSKITGAGSASIVVTTPTDDNGIEGGLIYIDNAPGKIFYDSDGTKLTDSANVLGGTDGTTTDTTVPEGTYEWDDTLGSGEGGWKAEAENNN
jgi:hypothetical protein